MPARFFVAASLVLTIGLAATAALADPPDFGLTIDLSPTSILDPRTGRHDPYGSLAVTGVMSGAFDNGVGYIFSADTILERHIWFPVLDLNYLRFSGQLNRQTDLGKVRLRASNISVFDRRFSGLLYNLTDVSLGIDRGFDLTDELALKLAINGARRFSTAASLDRYSVNPSASLSFSVLGLDAYLTASYSWREFVFRDRRDHFFGGGATLSRTFGDLTIGLTASVEHNRSTIRALSGTNFIIGPNFTYNVPLD
ncbi:MAG: hypothetical protein AB7I79_17330 [Rhizobiaceae bacterium]